MSCTFQDVLDFLAKIYSAQYGETRDADDSVMAIALNYHSIVCLVICDSILSQTQAVDVHPLILNSTFQLHTLENTHSKLHAVTPLLT